MSNNQTLYYIKYANRKIYSKDDHRYVSLYDLGKQVREGNDVSVMCHRTKLDITEQIVASTVAYLGIDKESLFQFIRSKV